MNPTLPACLCAFHRLRNSQIGIDAETVFVRGLRSYSVGVATELKQEQQKELTRVGRASFLNSVIEQSKKRAEELIESATTPEQKRLVLPDVVKWLRVAKKSQAELEGLQNG